MSPVFASRRRAEEFASLLEGPAQGTPRRADDAEFLSIVEALRAVPTPEPRPAFVASLREQLMAAADTELVPARPERLALPPRSRSRDRRLAAAIGGVAVVGASTSMALAAQSALPGETLYPLKRVIENAEIGMTTDPDAKAMTLLDSATSRLAEMAALDRAGELADDATTAETTLVDFRTQAAEGSELLLDEYDRTGDQRLIRRLHGFTGDSMETLTRLEPLVPDAARDELVEAARLLRDLDARAVRACPGCGGGIDEVPVMLLSDDAAAAPAKTVTVPGTTVAASPDKDRDRDRPRGRQEAPARSADDPVRQADRPTDTPGIVTAPPSAPSAPGGDDDGPLAGLEDVVGGTDTSTSKSRDLEDAVKESTKDVGETLDDTVDELTDPLLD